jgi:predicted Fe-S protein YdhL (DUF1289 family)
MTNMPSPWAAVTDVPSPCVNVCVMDNASGLCRGCRRTLDEIARWSAFCPDQKRAVLRQLPGRRASAST